MTKIRNYTKADWPMIDAWWKASGEVGPLETMMPLESSFIAEIDGVPAIAITLYLTNTPEVAYPENAIGNPEISGIARRNAGIALGEHIEKFAKSLGYRRLLCMTDKPELVNRYIELGYKPTLSGVTTMVRSL